MFNKALSLPADSLILDLEDSVTPQNKDSARIEVCEWLCNADFGGREKLVRMNPIDSAWGRTDLEAIIACKPDGIVVPKVLDSKSVNAVSEVIKSKEETYRKVVFYFLIFISTFGIHRIVSNILI